MGYPTRINRIFIHTTINRISYGYPKGIAIEDPTGAYGYHNNSVSVSVHVKFGYGLNTS